MPADQPTIQAGIDAASDGDTVLVADGTYTGSGNIELDFGGKAITVRSENGADHCVIDCNDQGRAFHFHTGEGPSSAVQGFTIQEGTADMYGGGIYCETGSPTIRENKIINNYSGFRGGGIQCYHDTSPVISNNIISYNKAPTGSGIDCWYASPMIINNMIDHNGRESPLSGSGSGIHVDYGSPSIRGNIIIRNTARSGGGITCAWYSGEIIDNVMSRNTADEGRGGGLFLVRSSPNIINNIIDHNLAEEGGGICCSDESSPFIANLTLAANKAGMSGGAIYCRFYSVPVIVNSIIWGNYPEAIDIYDPYPGDPPAITYSSVQDGYDGDGNIEADPFFTAGSLGEFYLSQTAAGQTQQSPCVNTGDPGSIMIEGTTRTDSIQDHGIIDMGYHYPFAEHLDIHLITGPGPGYDNPPLVRGFPPEQDPPAIDLFRAYGPPHFGVNVTCGDMLGDGIDEIITGPGPGEPFGPHVRGFRINSISLPGLSFLAYGTRRYGVNVAAGDLNNDGREEIITGAGPGAVFGPHVRAFSYNGSSVSPVPGVSFFAYGTRKWGVNVTGGDIDGDGFHEIVTGAGPGAVFGPLVRGWNVDGGTAAPNPEVSYFAYGSRQFGVRVALGDADGDGFAEIVTAPGPSVFFGAHLRGWNYDNDELTALTGFSFFAWPSAESKYGARVFAGADLDESSGDEILAGAGPDPSIGSPVRVFRYDGSQVTTWFSLQAYPSGWTHGATVAAGSF